MSDFRVDWSGRAFDYSEEEINAVIQVMRSGDPLTQGPKLAEFEKKFAAFVGVDHAFAVANATNALDLVALLARIEPGDEVVLPAHTFSATAIPFLRRGARLRWADIDPATRVVTAETLAHVVSDETKLIIVVHLYGLMPDMQPIRELADRHGAILLEDAAQALGASDQGTGAGAWGDYAVFSFQAQKNLTTLGEGGVLLVADPTQAALTPGLRHNGLRPYDRRDDRYWLPAMSNVDMDIPGEMPFNFCLSEAQCAVGAAALERVLAMNADRARRAEKFQAAVTGFPELHFQEVGPRKVHSWHLLAARYDPPRDGVTRDDFIARLAFEHRIKAIVQYYPLNRYPLFKHAGFGEPACPETDRFFDNMISFPFHHWLPEADFDYMIESTVETLTTLRSR
jgi:perosamine synthetase